MRLTLDNGRPRDLETKILFEIDGHYITREGKWLRVWRHNGTHAVSDSSYHDTSDALTVAKARVRYLAGMRGSAICG